MKQLLVAALLALPLALGACAPAAVQGVTVPPLLVKVSPGAAPGEAVTVQGRYLGGPQTGRVIVGAQADGSGGVALPAATVRSWTDTQIVFTVPQGLNAGGGWLVVEVAGRRSAGLPFSVRAPAQRP